MTRVEAIAILDGFKYNPLLNEQHFEALDMAVSALEKNESAEEWYKLLCEKWDSAENKGEWKRISPAGIYECSCCGQNVMTNDIECYKFCHGCGADMRKGGRMKYLCEWKIALEVEAQDENEAKTKYAEMLSNEFFQSIYPEDIEIIERGEE